MGYTEPPTRVDEEFLDENDWNTDIKDNMDYLKAEVDKMNDSIQSQPVGLEFQNGSKTILVTVKAAAAAGSGQVWALSGASPSPTTLVGKVSVQDIDGEVDRASFSFMVPPDYYYTITGFGNVDVTGITIWEFH